MATKFGSIDDAKRYIILLGGLSPEKVTFKEAVITEEIRKKIRHELVSPKCFNFKLPGGKEVTIVIDNYDDGYACWRINEKGFASRL